MGDQVVLLIQGMQILKVLVCRDKTFEQMKSEVQMRWPTQLLMGDVKMVIANVVSVETPYINFNPSTSNFTSVIVKE